MRATQSGATEYQRVLLPAGCVVCFLLCRGLALGRYLIYAAVYGTEAERHCWNLLEPKVNETNMFTRGQ